MNKDVVIAPLKENSVIEKNLTLMDDQREKTFMALEGIRPEQLWQRLVPSEWSIGEILNHNTLVIQSMFPMVRFAWRWFRWTSKLFENRPIQTEIEDPYRKQGYPHWEGFLWTSKYSQKNQVPLLKLLEETRKVHREVRDFFERKDESVLGHIYFILPVFGIFNLIQALSLAPYHDQLHYDDVITQWQAFRT